MELLNGITRVVRDQKLPSEMSEAIFPILRKYEVLVPRWVDILKISPNYEDDGATAYMTSHVEYRQAFLTIGLGWLIAVEWFREEVIVHELVECSVAAMRSFTRRIMRSYIENERERETLEEEYRLHCEGCISDLQRMMMIHRMRIVEPISDATGLKVVGVAEVPPVGDGGE